MEKLIECVPNFSEGRNKEIIDKIALAISKVKDIKLLHIDSGYAANRTVFTFAGNPEAVVEAAFQAAKVASIEINMVKHKGEHPRFGAMDVCPLIPVKGITIEETVSYARKLAKRVGEELGIPVYCYEEAAYDIKRKDLAYCRSGGYEKLLEKMKLPEWKPDFGPFTFNKNSGASAIGARNFLIAYNVNLNTQSVDIASEIARKIRESGFSKIKNGQRINYPGLLKHVKAIGWYIQEYGLAQVSINLTNFKETPLHVVFETIRKLAVEIGVEVKGSEIIGLLPLECIKEAGRYFSVKRNQLPDGYSEFELINIAIQEMGLSELKEFDPKSKILEYVLTR